VIDSIAARHVVLAQIVDLYAGRPIPSARCEVVDPHRANGRSVGVTTADENGVIEVDALAPGDVVVRVLLLRTGAS
jgi:hypothetical protein